VTVRLRDSLITSGSMAGTGRDLSDAGQAHAGR
jgi:hypothetical protein